MNILIGNRQQIARPNLPGIRRLLLFFMDKVRSAHPRRRWDEISLILADDAGMARINRLYLDREQATDVISFTLPGLPRAGAPCATGVGGELFVNVQRALEVAGRNVDRELALYIAHACDHLAGAEDRSPRGRRRMRTRELRWLREAERMRLLKDLLKIRKERP